MTIDMPSNVASFISSYNFYLETNTQTFRSPVNNAVQTLERAGARWVYDFTLRPMTPADANIWKAFLLKLKGRAESFNAFDPAYTMQGVGGGTPLVNGASQTGSTLNIDGCSPSVTGWALAGDYFSVNGEFKQITDDVDTNASGQAVLPFQPFLRNSPADNATIEIIAPRCPMKLENDSQLSRRRDFNSIYEQKTISALETFS